MKPKNPKQRALARSVRMNGNLNDDDDDGGIDTFEDEDREQRRHDKTKKKNKGPKNFMKKNQVANKQETKQATKHATTPATTPETKQDQSTEVTVSDTMALESLERMVARLKTRATCVPQEKSIIFDDRRNHDHRSKVAGRPENSEKYIVLYSSGVNVRQGQR